MEDNRVSTFLSALKLDEHPLHNQFMFVEELHFADGSFILSALIKYQIEEGRPIIFVLCHNSFGHFLSIGLKLGYNLQSLEASGQVYVIDLLGRAYHDDYLMGGKPLQRLFFEIRNKVDECINEKGVCVIVESVGNLLAVGENNVEEFFAFINYLRVIPTESSHSSLVMSFQNITDDFHCQMTCRALRHVADVAVVLNELQTGRASDVTGHFLVLRREDKFRKTEAEYHYQLEDKFISTFPVGLRNSL